MSYIATLVNDDVHKVVYMQIEGIQEDSLSQLQEKVGGYIEPVRWLFPDLLGDDVDVWACDDAIGKPLTVEGKYKGHDFQVFGNLCFSKHDDEGETVGLSCDECLDILVKITKDAKFPIPVALDVTNEEYWEWQNCFDTNELFENSNVFKA